jgi:glycosyltransferase involved in cell wall biosynthesis
LTSPSIPPGGHTPARLVFLLEELNFGGTQRQTLELARRLDPARYRSEIWLLRAGEKLAPLARSWQIPVYPLARTSFVGPASLVNLWRRLQHQKIDLFIPLTAIPNIWGRILTRLAGVAPIIGNVRGNTPHRQHEKWLWPLTNCLICNNEKLKSLLVDQYHIPPEHIKMIYNGVDTDFFTPQSTGNNSGNPVILSIGRLAPDKNQETLIDAFRLVLQDHPDAELWLVGDGPRRSFLEKRLQQTLPPRQFSLFPAQVDIRPFLHQATLFALSSVTEALPNVVLEAMATGLPVVATQVGGLPEIVLPGQSGWLVPPREPALMAEAIKQLLADPDRRRSFGKAGRERVERNFSFNVMVRRHEALFDACLAKTGRT